MIDPIIYFEVLLVVVFLLTQKNVINDENDNF